MFTPRRAGSVGGSFLTTPHSQSRSRRSGTPLSYGRSPCTPGMLSMGQFQDSSLHQSQVLEETADHVVELFGTVLPVLVSEALVEAEPGTDISARISSCGWAWLVCGRKLFVWQYKQGSRSRNPNGRHGPGLHINLRWRGQNTCRMLTLPPSDLAHRADLVCMLLRGDELAPAALAVTPAGILRYWPNIAHESSSTDALADLQGEECCSLTDTQPLGCIVATTTSSLMLVTPSTIEGQTTLLIKPLKAPQGLLAGIGRRVSSFIFGAMPSQLEARHLVKVLVEPTEEEDEKFVYVLLRNSLQKWFLEEGPERLCSECDLDRSMKEQFHEAVWDRENTLPRHLKAWCIDMQLSSNGVAVLMAALNIQVSQQLYYAIGTVDVRNLGSPADSPASFTDFTVLRFSEQYTEKDEEALLSYKFVLPSANRRSSFVYSDTKVYCVTPGSNVDDLDVIEFKKDKLLGAGSYEGTPLFFSHVNGIVSIHSIHAPAHDVSRAVERLLQDSDSPAGDERMEVTSVDESNFAKLRSAFVLFCKSELLKSEEIVDSIFPGRAEPSSETDSALDTCVSQLGYRLVDDVPAVDPRWAQQHAPGGSAAHSSASLIIHHQLEDKLRAHQLLLNFLKGVGLWPRLYAVTVRGSPMATNLLLQEQAEKLVAAMQLRSLQSQFSAIIDAGIRRAVQAPNVSAPGKLTAVDHFYQKVSEFDKIFPALVDEEEELRKGLSPRDEFALITEVNAIFVRVLQEVCLFRDKEQLTYESREISVEFRPWTTALRDVICKQHALAATNAVPVADDAAARGRVFQQLTDLADLVLNGHKVHLDSLAHDPATYEALELQYQQDRKRLIAPLIKATQYERAAALAEKYYDFASLVEICEVTKNKEKLENYMIQFKDQGFSEFVFKWQLDTGRRGELLDQPASQHGNLERFLEGHDTLSWLHDIQMGNMGKAATTLHRLGQREEKHMLRKKYLLSHSKLAALASDTPEAYTDLINDINKELAVITYQESLPSEVKEMHVQYVQAYCLDAKDMQVLGPEKLIEMYISVDNVYANEYDFTKALELLDFINEPTRVQELRMRIWCAAILRNQ
ncbi:hypothetical protein V5799_011175 [Amblyomma americanum]|uniref:Uncharacterized protein n=1 Tax=Amblyomma americanum TaxID=6943 RepID=A0AAQ4EIN1_AMBAM